MKIIKIQPILDNIRQFFQVILTIFTLNISEIMRFYKSLQKFMIFHETNKIFLVKSFTFVHFCSFAMYFVDFRFCY